MQPIKLMKFWRQFTVLVQRNLRLILNDKLTMTSLILQAPFMVLVIKMVVDPDCFTSNLINIGSRTALFIISAMAAFMGTLNSYREICKEREIILREASVGVSLLAVVLSKAFVLLLIEDVQAAILTFGFVRIVNIPQNHLLLDTDVEIFVSILLMLVASSAIGLLISAIFKSGESAILVVLVLMIGQVVFSGIMFTLTGVAARIAAVIVCAGELVPRTSMFRTVLQLGAIYALLAVSMNLCNGFTGLFSLGQAGFMTLGAYTYAIFTIPTAARPGVYYLYGVADWLADLHLPIIAALLAAGVVGALFAALIGAPVLKLKSDYLAIATLGFAEVVRIVVASSPLNRITNGSLGLTKIPSFSSYYGIFIVAAVCITLIVLIINSSYGRAFKAIRDDEIAAEAMGIDLAKHKQMSFIISSFFAAIGGALMAMFLGAVSSTTFTIAVTYFILLIVVIGGMGSVTGSVISAFLVIASREWWLRFLDKTTYIGDFRVPLLKTGFRMVVFSVILMVVVLFFRTGIMGDKEFSWDRIAARCKKLFGGKKAAVSGGENHE